MVIVSAFVRTNIVHRDIISYVKMGEELLNVNTDKIVFLEKDVYEQYFKGHTYPKTQIILSEWSDCYLSNISVPNFELKTDNPTKDTLDYIKVQCSKTEWLEKAIKLRPDNDQFVWIDFGIRHIFNGSVEEFQHLLININNKVYDKIRYPGCRPLQVPFHLDITKHISWFFCGGIIGGQKDVISWFAQRVKSLCTTLIQEKGILMWEVNIWYIIASNDPTMFDLYLSDHNIRMIRDY